MWIIKQQFVVEEKLSTINDTSGRLSNQESKLNIILRAFILFYYHYSVQA